MGKRKYATPEEAAEANRTKQKGRNEKNSKKRNSDPLLKAEAMKKQVEANARYRAKLPVEQLKEYNRLAKQAERARKKQEANKTLSNKDFISQFKNMQLKVACEQAQEN